MWDTNDQEVDKTLRGPGGHARGERRQISESYAKCRFPQAVCVSMGQEEPRRLP